MTAPDDIIRIYDGVFEGGDTILQQIEELSLRMQHISRRSYEVSERVHGVYASAQEIRQRTLKLEKELLKMDEQNAQRRDEKFQDEVEKINERLQQINIPNLQISPGDPVGENFSFGVPSLVQMSQLVSGVKQDKRCHSRTRSRSPRRNESPTDHLPRPRLESCIKGRARRFRRFPTPE